MYITLWVQLSCTWTRVAEMSQPSIYIIRESGAMHQINRRTQRGEHKNLTQFARWLHCSVPSSVFDDLSDAFRLPGGRRWGLLKSASRRDAVAVATKIYRHCGWSSYPRKKTNKRQGSCMSMRMRSLPTVYGHILRRAHTNTTLSPMVVVTV